VDARVPRTVLALAVLAITPVASGQSPATASAATWAVQTRAAAFTFAGAPTAVVHAPAGFDPRAPLHLVVFLHGYSGCAEVLMRSGPTRCRPADDVERDGWDLATQHDAAGTNTLFVIPQLAFMRRDGDPGCFARPGCFRRFVEELLARTLAAQLGASHTLDDVGSITLVAHSGGFEAALAILERGDVETKVRGVVLLDALYGGAERFADWLRGRRKAGVDARLVSVYTGSGNTRRESRELLGRVRRMFGKRSVAQTDTKGIAAELAHTSLVIAPSRAAHKLVPEQHLAQLLAALPWLPRRAGAK
jgi:hypothetical protein